MGVGGGEVGNRGSEGLVGKDSRVHWGRGDVVRSGAEVGSSPGALWFLGTLVGASEGPDSGLWWVQVRGPILGDSGGCK